MVLVHQEKVVKVASHFLGRGHGGVQVKLLPLRKGREDPGQHIRLYLGGHVQLRSDTLLFRSDGGEVFHIPYNVRFHFANSPGQHSDFVRLFDLGQHLRLGRIILGKSLCFSGDG